MSLTSYSHCDTIIIVMEMYVTITPQFQVQLPVAARKQSGIMSHGRAKIVVKKGQITLKPVPKGFMKWAGAFTVKKPIPADTIRDAIDYSSV